MTSHQTFKELIYQIRKTTKYVVVLESEVFDLPEEQFPVQT